MKIIGVLIIAVVGVIALAVMKNNGSTYTPVLQIAVVLFLVVSALPYVKELYSLVDSLQFSEGVSYESLGIMLKVFAILVSGSVVADICRDNNENAIAGAVELSVKVVAVCIALPVFSSVVSIAVGFLQG